MEEGWLFSLTQKGETTFWKLSFLKTSIVYILIKKSQPKIMPMGLMHVSWGDTYAYILLTLLFFLSSPSCQKQQFFEARHFATHATTRLTKKKYYGKLLHLECWALRNRISTNITLKKPVEKSRRKVNSYGFQKNWYRLVPSEFTSFFAFLPCKIFSQRSLALRTHFVVQLSTTNFFQINA